jgi:hypothetical protein
VFANKLYEISNNVGPQQLQNIVDENLKIENEMDLNLLSTSSSFSDLSSFKEEEKIAGESEESEDDTDNETTAGESESDILPEVPFQAVQDNNSHAQPKDFVPKQRTDGNIVRSMIDNQLNKLGGGGYK